MYILCGHMHVCFIFPTFIPIFLTYILFVFFILNILGDIVNVKEDCVVNVPAGCCGSHSS